MMKAIALALVVLTFIASPPVRAEDPPQPPKEAKAPDKEKEKEKDKPAGQTADDKLSVTEHEIKIKGEPLKYRAIAGTLGMKDEAGKLKANVFFVAYEKITDPPDLSKRPITYVFNGGPGAAAIWLHLGTAGPRRVKLTEDGSAPVPPYTLVDNESTWLDSTDMVFIDPVGTGFSRAAQGEDPKQFFGLDEDVRWVGDFIRLYTTRFKRWDSPKFMAGESYGTTRAAALSDYLIDAHGISLNGVILISAVLNFGTISFGNGNDLPYVMYLPTYTATAHLHKKLPPDLQSVELTKTLAEVRAFALGEYTAALAKGDSLTADQRKQVVDKLSRYTGLPADLIEKSDLRIEAGLFRKSILADQRRVIGRFDGGITGNDPAPIDRDPQYDPSMGQYLAAYSGAFNGYIRSSLKFESDLNYDALSGKVHPWNFGRAGNGYVYVADNLRNSMLKNSHMNVMIACGYHDLATPFLAAEYTADHLGGGPAVRKNVELTYYEGGHMMYHHRPALEKLKTDIAAFVQRSVK